MSSVVFRSVSKSYGEVRRSTGSTSLWRHRSSPWCADRPNPENQPCSRSLVGLESIDEGIIELSGQDITNFPPARRPIGYVPQSFALYPHLTVYQNIGYPLTLAHVARDEIARRIDRAAGILSIGHLLNKTPDQLSGGEKQSTPWPRPSEKCQCLRPRRSAGRPRLQAARTIDG